MGTATDFKALRPYVDFDAWEAGRELAPITAQRTVTDDYGRECVLLTLACGHTELYEGPATGCYVGVMAQCSNKACRGEL